MSFEDVPRKTQGMVIGENLELCSVAELEHRIEALQIEMERVKAMLQLKQASKSAADAFFRS